MKGGRQPAERRPRSPASLARPAPSRQLPVLPIEPAAAPAQQADSECGFLPVIPQRPQHFHRPGHAAPATRGSPPPLGIGRQQPTRRCSRSPARLGWKRLPRHRRSAQLRSPVAAGRPGRDPRLGRAPPASSRPLPGLRRAGFVSCHLAPGTGCCGWLSSHPCYHPPALGRLWSLLQPSTPYRSVKRNSPEEEGLYTHLCPGPCSLAPWLSFSP